MGSPPPRRSREQAHLCVLASARDLEGHFLLYFILYFTILFDFFYPHPRACFLILERKREGEKNNDVKLIASHMCPHWAPNL